MLCREAVWRLVHPIAGAESEEETARTLVGECGEGLGHDGRVASYQIRYCDSDSDPPGPRGDGGEGSEGFWRCGGFCPVEEVVVYEDGVEAVFLTEPCALYNTTEGFIGREEDSASEPDLILHTSVTGGLKLDVTATADSFLCRVSACP